MGQHFDSYIEGISNRELRDAIETTRQDFRSKVLQKFDDVSDRQVLFYGDVQSGKTSHMLGVIADALDDNFSTVIVLTSPNTRLVDQTYKRVFSSLPDALVCKNDSTTEFQLNQRRVRPKKAVVVLGKIPRVLKTWLKLFETTNALSGNPILIVDDEADATSLNTKVNKVNEVSKINEQLTKIRSLATGCIYLQVTGTPQAILLQTDRSGWSIEDAVHFPPGDAYIGGDFFFTDIDQNPHTRIMTGPDALEYRYLEEAVRTHMVTSSIFKLEGRETCNMLLHPSHLTDIHFIKRA